ncbi:phosphoinositide phosphatase SAC8-like isoform X2 [Malus sylvestris]|nr:phosphoinositide phosphatase SAC8-like isoform X2 [Malus sylvestris]
MRFLSCNEGMKNSTAQEKKDEAYFMALLKTVQSTPGLYFSYETDITLNFQRRCKLVEGWMAKPIWKQADPRFVWNRNLLDELIEYKTAQLKLKGSSATLTIVSRRCTMRLGTRMWRRGANLDGDVANFIEAEQLVETEGFQSSLLQHGDEGQLSTAFSAEMQNLPNVRYVSFDFHHVCGNSNFENLKVLYEQISEQFEKQGYFLVDVKGNILEEQNGIVRSNCIDWLDRTNVTQSYLAQKSLDARLQRTGVLDSFESISIFVEDYQTFRALWVEQGDEISLEYPGTYALKGDLVRYGKQTFGGIIKDGMSALSRYFLNNFRMA